MKKFIKSLIIITILLIPFVSKIYAEDPIPTPPECIAPQTLANNVCIDPVPTPITVNLTIRDGGTIVFFGTTPLAPAGNININDHTGTPHIINSDSVLSMLNDADILNSSFNISDLEYYNSFGSFYLKCINDKCDNWQYTVNNSYPTEGIDKKILSGGENVYFYFGPQYKVVLDSNSINTNDNLNVTAKSYDYQNNAWINRNGITVGLTQPDPSNPYSPKEIQTKTVDQNGLATFSNIPIGNYNVGIQQDYYFPTETLTVSQAPEPVVVAPALVVHYSGGGAILSASKTTMSKTVFDTNKAYSFLLSQQKDDGSFGNDLYTDWATIALSTTNNTQEQNTKLIKYLSTVNTKDYQLTDYERHVMALMSLGINPYNVNGENYINKITSNFDGKQFGDTEKDNDDIFALIVLQNAGYKQEDKIISNDIDFILSKQKDDGSWDSSVDLTGATIEALSSFNQNDKVKNALQKAKAYLKQNQKNDGGFGNVSSTSWAIQGILALGEKPTDWINNTNTPIDYLAINQDADGGIKGADIQNRIWQTSYTLTSLSGKTWNQIMQQFSVPIVKTKDIKITSSEKVNQEITKKLPVKISHKNIKIPASQNTASVIQAVEKNTTNTDATPKQNWFRRFIGKIFGF
ncbi:MAG: prenyltransferase/squalene oxidase repeat-containing protein [bacterium]